MWAQLISAKLKPGSDDGLTRMLEQLQATERPNSGLVRSLTMRDEKDPSRVHILVVFENEDAARARESDPQRQEAMKPARATMAEIFDGAPEFTDLTVVFEYTP